jgi:branched-chain amino acid transport system ATP-binding protein
MESTGSNPEAERGNPDMVLETKGLTRRFGQFTAVNAINFSVVEGDFHSIIGPNGAGKTTFFDLIAGRIRPTKGEIIYQGESITDRSEEQRAAMGISRVFQITQLFNELTVMENLKLAAQSRYQNLSPLAKRDDAIADRSHELFDRLDLDADQTTIVQTLSHGEKKRLEIGMSLATDPDLLMLDEPTSGLSGKDSDDVMNLIDRLSEGLTVLLIEHDVDIVLDYSDVVTVLHQGSLIAKGTPEEITGSDMVQEVYLGGYE